MRDISLHSPELFFQQLILVAGPPRSGTAVTARSLNEHPRILTVSDDHVSECWGLYQYRTRTGLIQRLRDGEIPAGSPRAQQELYSYLVNDGFLRGVEPSGKTAGWPVSTPEEAGAGHPVRSVRDRNLIRHMTPVAELDPERWLCLKSPEISLVIPQLAQAFPSARFIVICRSLEEIACSMYCLGESVNRFPVFHRRWAEEKNNAGQWQPPPAVPPGWISLWQRADGFERCVLNAGAYLKSLAEGLHAIPRNRFRLFSHQALKINPVKVFQQWGSLLNLDPDGFGPALGQIQNSPVDVPQKLMKKCRKIRPAIGYDGWWPVLEDLGGDLP